MSAKSKFKLGIVYFVFLIFVGFVWIGFWILGGISFLALGFYAVYIAIKYYKDPKLRSTFL